MVCLTTGKYLNFLFEDQKRRKDSDYSGRDPYEGALCGFGSPPHTLNPVCLGAKPIAKLKKHSGIPSPMAITVIGTSHIAKQSLREVRQAIEEGKPDIIAIELDRKRLPALLAKKREHARLSDIGRIGLKGYLFALLGAWAEKKLGDAVGVKPGAEMKLAYLLARKAKIKVALIDQDIEITLKRLSRELTWKEKFRFLKDILKGIFGGTPEFVFDLNKVPEKEIILRMVEKVRISYPNVYKVLIEERNRVMIDNIKKLAYHHQGQNILVIVGAGHKEEIEEAFSKSYSVSVSYTLPKGMSLSMDEGAV